MRFRWLKRVLWGIFVSVLLFAAYLAINRELTRRAGNRELAATIAEIDAEDPDWRWEALNAKRKQVPDAENSAPLIPKIFAGLPADWNKRWEEFQADAPPELAANVRLPERDRTRATENLDAVAESLRIARSLKQFPNGRRDYVLAHNPIDTRLPEVQNTRVVANLLMWDARLAAEEGNATRAAGALEAMLNTSRSLGDEPPLISQLVRMATRTITIRSAERLLAQFDQPASLSALRLEAFSTALAADLEEPLLLYGLVGERGSFDILIERLMDGSIDAKTLGNGRAGLDLRGGFWLYRARIPSDRAFYLRWMGDAIAAARKPIHEQPAALRELPPVTLEGEHRLVVMLLPAVDKMAASYWRSVAEGRCAVVGLACERFRLKHGRWPRELAELCPEFLAAVPLDPFDGQPLRLAKQPDGLVIHSVGRNQQSPVSGTPRPGLPEGVEIGFRLWNPEARRQAPPPAPPEPKDDGQP